MYQRGAWRIPISSDLFESVGERISSGYNFRLDIKNGEILSKKGQAQARDLKKALDECSSFYKVAKGKNITIRFHDFVLFIDVYANSTGNEMQETRKKWYKSVLSRIKSLVRKFILV